ncbi:MAG: L-arabinose isomerase, partial [Clostridia bacterium]
VSRSLRVCRFGDNMRDVAVTEGDKVEAERVLGWSVNTHGIGDLIACMEEVTCAQVEAQMDVYRERYDIGEAVLDATRYQARQEVALRTVLDN